MAKPLAPSVALLFVAAAACGNGTTTAAPIDDGGPTAPDATDAGTGDAAPPPVCNGHAELCARHFDEVAYPCTHNAYSAGEYGFTPPFQNQKSGLAKQLTDGVRCMMLDIYDVDGTNELCHVTCDAVKKPHAEALAAIKAFMDAHPREVVTLDYEDYVPAASILADLTAAGLDGSLSVVDSASGPWPTLGEMIDTNRRLVVGIEGHTANVSLPLGIHDFYSLAWDTPYTFTQPADFSCALNRGKTTNALFLVNHWLSTGGLPDEAKAPVANAYATLYGRAKACGDGAKDMPNFVAVDFYEDGDLFRAIDTLNGF